MWLALASRYDQHEGREPRGWWEMAGKEGMPWAINEGLKF